MYLCIGDAHLKNKLWRSRSLKNDTFVAFRHAVQYAVDNDAEALILAGDTFDPVTSGHMAKYQEIISAYNGPVLGVQGQHDWADPCWFQVSGITGEDIHSRKVEINGVSFYGVENQPRHRLSEILAEVPPVDFLVLHQLAKPSLSYNWDLDPEWIPKHVNHVIIGDLHQQVGFDIPSGNRGLYTGSLSPCKSDEIENNHGFLVFEGDGSDFTFTYQIFEARYIVRKQAISEAQAANLLADSEREELAAHTEDELSPALLVKFASTDPIRAHVDEVKAWCSKHHILCIAETTARYRKDEEIEVTAPTNLDMAGIVNQATDDSRVQTLLTNLLRAPQQATIENFKQEQFNFGRVKNE